MLEKPVEALKVFLASARIDATEPVRPGVGRILTYRDDPRRTIVVYLGGRVVEERARGSLRTILLIEDEWLLIPQFGDRVLVFPGSERTDLLERLWHRHLALDDFEDDICPVGVSGDTLALDDSEDDIYLVGVSGDTLINFGEHSFEIGLVVQLNDVRKTGRLLEALNEHGAELELLVRAG